MGILKLLLRTVQMKYWLVPCAVSAKCGLEQIYIEKMVSCKGWNIRDD